MLYRAVLTICAILCVMLCGCGGHYQMINGEKVEVLSPAEEIEMKSIARATLARSKALSSRERELIKGQEPVLKIRYIGDRTGDATVSWKLPGKTVSLFMRGVFFDPSAQWMMKIREDQPEYLDLRQNRPRRVEKR